MNSPLHRRRHGRKGAWIGLGVVALALAIAACSKYGEGERCQSENGDDDCTSGLTCTPAAQLTNTTSDRCCPSNRSTATEQVCKVPVSVGGSDDASAGADTGLGSTGDASADADAGSDAADASDASDAPADG